MAASTKDTNFFLARGAGISVTDKVTLKQTFLWGGCKTNTHTSPHKQTNTRTHMSQPQKQTLCVPHDSLLPQICRALQLQQATNELPPGKLCKERIRRSTAFRIGASCTAWECRTCARSWKAWEVPEHEKACTWSSPKVCITRGQFCFTAARTCVHLRANSSSRNMDSVAHRETSIWCKNRELDARPTVTIVAGTCAGMLSTRQKLQTNKNANISLKQVTCYIHLVATASTWSCLLIACKINHWNINRASKINHWNINRAHQSIYLLLSGPPLFYHLFCHMDSGAGRCWGKQNNLPGGTPFIQLQSRKHEQKFELLCHIYGDRNLKCAHRSL